MSTAAPSDELITTRDEFKAALALLRARGVTKAALCEELGRSKPTVWAWANRSAPPRYCALHLKVSHGITKDAVRAA